MIDQTSRRPKIFRLLCSKPATSSGDDFTETTNIGEKSSSDNTIERSVETINAIKYASIHNIEQVGRVITKPEDDFISNVKEFDESRMEESEGPLKN